ncbi:MAG TPA: hypothetical protein PLA90_11585, partial [Candidatus Sumerlaeota bacterium]|nr:hypothetical protein [Candidatus Sumerlaeota bacterium]
MFHRLDRITGFTGYGSGSLYPVNPVILSFVLVFFLKTAVDRLSSGFSFRRARRPPSQKDRFYAEKAVPGTANLLIGAVQSLTRKVRGPKPFSPHNGRTKDLFSALNCCFQVLVFKGQKMFWLGYLLSAVMQYCSARFLRGRFGRLEGVSR